MPQISVKTTISTSNSGRIAKRMGNHFRHKVAVEWPQSGAIVYFPEGYCQLHALDNQLTIECGADAADDLQAITDTIDRHLPHFTSEPVGSIIWRRQ